MFSADGKSEIHTTTQTVFLFSHLIRISRLTSNFTSLGSPDAAAHLMAVLCKSTYKLHSFQMATESFGKKATKRTASAWLRNTILRAIEDEILLLKTLEGYIRPVQAVLEQHLATKTRKAEAAVSQDNPEPPSLTTIAQLMDEMLPATELTCASVYNTI